MQSQNIFFIPNLGKNVKCQETFDGKGVKMRITFLAPRDFRLPPSTDLQVVVGNKNTFLVAEVVVPYQPNMSHKCTTVYYDYKKVMMKILRWYKLQTITAELQVLDSLPSMFTWNKVKLHSPELPF